MHEHLAAARGVTCLDTQRNIRATVSPIFIEANLFLGDVCEGYDVGLVCRLSARHPANGLDRSHQGGGEHQPGRGVVHGGFGAELK